MVNYAVPKLDTIGSTGRYEARGCILWGRNHGGTKDNGRRPRRSGQRVTVSEGTKGTDDVGKSGNDEASNPRISHPNRS